MAAARLPIPGEDNGTWGDILNTFLLVEHNIDGSLKAAGLINSKANDLAVVHKTGNEAITGVKAFANSPTVPLPTNGTDVANKAYVDSVVDSGNNDNLALVATTGSYTDLTNKPTLSTVAGTGSYDDLTNAPALSTVATSGLYADLTSKPTLSTVATTGAYDDLSSKPTLSTVATTGNYTDLTNKPTLSTVATSGSYADLTNRPSFADVATSGLYGDLDEVPVLSTVATSGSYTDLTSKPTLSTVATSGSYADLTNKPVVPDDATIVHLAGAQTVTGAKDFTGGLKVSGQDVVATNDGRLSNTRTPSDGSVSTTKLLDESVTEPKLAVSNNPASGDLLGWNGTSMAWGSPTTAPVTSVNGHTGAAVVTKGDVGLGNVDNTNDAGKPVSTATQTALNAKLSKAGDTMTGLLTLSGTPTDPNHAATKSYVDGKSSGSSNLVIGTSSPTPAAGVSVLWVNTSGGNMTLNLVTGE